MKNKPLFSAVLISGLLAFSQQQALALQAEPEPLLKLPQTKETIYTEQATQFKKEPASLKDEKPEREGSDHYHSIQSLSTRLDKLEEAKEEAAKGMTDIIQLSGQLEAEANFTKINSDIGNDDKFSDIHLAKAEIDINVVVNSHVLGHLALLWENDGGDSKLNIDEGIIVISGNEAFPLTLNAGKMVIPFGRYESHFVTDPATLTLGETNDGALMAGYVNNLLELNFGFFNGEINKLDKNDSIDNFFASAAFNVPIKGATIRTGVSYTSNLALGNTLRNLSISGEISDYVGGFSVFANLTFIDRINIIGEYVTAVKDFAISDDLSFISANNRKPQAWNIEAATLLTENLEAAVRYGGTEDFEDIEPEKIYGAALLYSIFNNTSLTLEYLYGKYQNTDTLQSTTLQVAVSF